VGKVSCKEELGTTNFRSGYVPLELIVRNNVDLNLPLVSLFAKLFGVNWRKNCNACSN